MSAGVGNGRIRENYLCTGDVHCVEAVVALDRLFVAKEEGRKLSCELEGLDAWFSGGLEGGLASDSLFLPEMSNPGLSDCRQPAG